MIEMKVWVTPEVEVQNFQANEYVSVCYVGSNPLDLKLDTTYWYYKDNNNTGKPEDRIYVDSDDIKNGKIDNDANSGRVYTAYREGILGASESRAVYDFFVDKKGNYYLVSSDSWLTSLKRDNTEWS